jgi:multiple sugar transport system permease protein
MTTTDTSGRVVGLEAQPPGLGIRTKRRTFRKDGRFWPLVFVLPLLIGLIAFYIWPIFQTLFFSFNTVGTFGGLTWSGFENYTRLFTDPDVARSIANSLVYTVILLLGIPIGAFIASLLHRRGVRFTGLYRVLFFVPYVAMPTAVGLVWKQIFNSDHGLVNGTLSLAGIPGPKWLTTEWLVLVSLGIVGVWLSLGFNIIILSAGLRNIPESVYEAAELDGASPTRQYFSITVPLLSPILFFLTVVTAVGGFQLFDLLYVMIGTDNPVLQNTQSVVYLFYNYAFVTNDKGYAASIAILIMVLIGLMTAVQFFFQRRWVKYDL